MLENLAKLYQELIIEHSKNPRCTGTLDTPNSKKALGINASCGDKLLLSLEITDNSISDIKHDSDGCAIFRSSCSMMSQLLKDKSKDEALHIVDVFLKLITFDETQSFTDEERNVLGKMQIFENIRNYPARVKCAALFVRTLQDLILNWDSQENIIISTEDDD